MKADSKLLKVEYRARERMFYCAKCKFSNKRAAVVRRHFIVHSNKKPFHCSLCDYTTAYKDNLQKHMLIHSEIKPFFCPHCTFTCRIKGNLTEHMMIHTNQKNYSCSECDYRCIQRSSLKRHLLNHTGEKPYRCPKCSYAARQSSSLKIHIAVHHSDETPFLCKYCDCKFKVALNLRLHMRRAHVGVNYYSEKRTKYVLNKKIPIMTNKTDKLTQVDNVESNKETKGKKKMIEIEDLLNILLEEPTYLNTDDSNVEAEKNYDNNEESSSSAKILDANQEIKQPIQNKQIISGEISETGLESSLIHTKKDRFSCRICWGKFFSLESITKHVAKCKFKQHFSCTICHYLCNMSPKLKRHVLIHKSKRCFSCQYCSFITGVYERFRKHSENCWKKSILKTDDEKIKTLEQSLANDPGIIWTRSIKRLLVSKDSNADGKAKTVKSKKCMKLHKEKKMAEDKENCMNTADN